MTEWRTADGSGALRDARRRAAAGWRPTLDSQGGRQQLCTWLCRWPTLAVQSNCAHGRAVATHVREDLLDLGEAVLALANTC